MDGISLPEFCNFYVHEFEMDGKMFKTSEHAFQYQKFLYNNLTNQHYSEYLELIRNANTPYIAKILGKQQIEPARYPWRKKLNDVIKKYLSLGVVIDPCWEDKKNEAMYKAIFAKFNGSGLLKSVLLSTSDKYIVHPRGDSHWGIGHDGNGLNIVGLILMEVRNRV